VDERRGAAARAYHERTKHSRQSVQADAFFLDWPNQPMPFKVYTDLEPIPLPPEPPRAEAPALACMAAAGEGGQARPTLEALARLFFLMAGITKRIEVGGRAHYFRAAACTGALYHVEVYLVCGEVPAAGGRGLSPGVYHLAVHDYAARRLREGDFRALLARAAGEDSAPPACFVLTSTYWRNAWKYRARAYRHCFWDSGTMLANLLAAAAALGVPARVAASFADGPVNALLGVNPDEEAALALVELGERAPPPPPPAELPELSLKTMALSPERVDYPLIREIHAASSLADGRAAAAWREAASRLRDAASLAGGEALPLAPAGAAGDSVDAAILRRGSARRFDRERSIRF